MLSRLDASVIAAFVVYCIVSGLRSRRIASKNLEEYFLAGRTLPGWKAGLSMAATQFAADTPLLVTGMIAAGGIFSLWRLWIYALAFLLMGLVLGPAWRRTNVLTDAELAELRYGTRLATTLRVVKAIYFGIVTGAPRTSPTTSTRGSSPGPGFAGSRVRAPWSGSPGLRNLIILGLAFLVLTQLDAIQSAWHTTLLLGAGMGVPLVLRWCWWRMTALAELGSIVLSSLLSPLVLVTLSSEGARLLVVALASTGTAIGLSLLQNDPRAARPFYERVRPPGFWGPVARAVGDDPAVSRYALRRGAAWVVIFAGAVFAWLVGVGTLLYGGSPPSWLPFRPAWIVLLLAGASASTFWIVTRWKTLGALDRKED